MFIIDHTPKQQKESEMYKVYKTAVSQYTVSNEETGEVVGVYSTVRFAMSVAKAKNIQSN